MEDGKHVLCLMKDNDGQVLLHADGAGLDILITSLQNLRSKIDKNQCDHDHLFTESWGGTQLTETTQIDKKYDICHHFKINGWTDEWAIKHSFKKEK